MKVWSDGLSSDGMGHEAMNVRDQRHLRRQLGLILKERGITVRTLERWPRIAQIGRLPVCLGTIRTPSWTKQLSSPIWCST